MIFTPTPYQLEQIKEMAASGKYTREQIGALFNMDRRLITYWLWRNGIKVKKHAKKFDESYFITPEIKEENGIQVKVYPPMWARGIMPARSVGWM